MSATRIHAQANGGFLRWGRRSKKQRITTLLAGGVLAFAAALAAGPALAAQDCRPGLFEDSPVVP
jgi:hypothetical protein